MNERIQQLAIEAKLIVSEYNGFDRTQLSTAHQTFAELIVNECIGVADHSNVTGKSIVGERIKQHFGVK